MCVGVLFAQRVCVCVVSFRCVDCDVGMICVCGVSTLNASNNNFYTLIKSKKQALQNKEIYIVTQF